MIHWCGTTNGGVNHVTKNGEGIEASETKRVQEARDEARPNGEKEALFKT